LVAILPEPDAAARQHSARVSGALREQIEKAGGFLPFRDWMNTALYAPGLGYYAAGARKFGPDGDFVTAPELTPLFGRTLATDVAAIISASEARHVLELGAGSGKLARDILTGLDALGAKVQRYSIVEVSADLAERQRETLKGDARVQWQTALPSNVDGAIVMNEVLDALPPDIVSRRSGAWFERGVALYEGKFMWAESPLADAQLQALAEARFPPDGDYTSEINRNAERLVDDLGQRLRSGAMLIIDYGFPAHEFYHPQRGAGTVMAHYRHRATSDPFLWPGLADVTTHVDFSAIAAAGERAGLHVAGYTSQAAYLIGAGLLDHLLDAGDPESAGYLRHTANVQKLTSPAEMGELFKCLVLARTNILNLRGFTLSNQARRLEVL
jgi:SAM-dependent MidA family methyltransferase